MMSKLVLIILLLSPSLSLAGENYALYREMCKGVTPVQEMIFLGDDLGMATMPIPPRVIVGSLKEAGAQLRFASYGSETKAILEDPDFTQALKDCFPGDEATQGYFKSALIYQDLVGKTVAGAGFLVAGEGMGLVLSRLGAVGLWLNQRLLALFAIDVAHSLFQSFVKLDKQLHPSKAVHEMVHRRIKYAMELNNRDLEDLKQMLQKQPENPYLLRLLEKTKAQGEILKRDLEKE